MSAYLPWHTHIGELVGSVALALTGCGGVRAQVIASDNRTGRCYIETASLDGETNLKVHIAPVYRARVRESIHKLV